MNRQVCKLKIQLTFRWSKQRPEDSLGWWSTLPWAGNRPCRGHQCDRTDTYKCAIQPCCGIGRTRGRRSGQRTRQCPRTCRRGPGCSRAGRCKPACDSPHGRSPFRTECRCKGLRTHREKKRKEIKWIRNSHTLHCLLEEKRKEIGRGAARHVDG